MPLGWVTADGFIADRSGGLCWVVGDEELAACETALIEEADAMMPGRVI